MANKEVMENKMPEILDVQRDIIWKLGLSRDERREWLNETDSLDEFIYVTEGLIAVNPQVVLKAEDYYNGPSGSPSLFELRIVYTAKPRNSSNNPNQCKESATIMFKEGCEFVDYWDFINMDKKEVRKKLDQLAVHKAQLLTSQYQRATYIVS